MTSEYTLVLPYDPQVGYFVENDKLYPQLSSIALKFYVIYIYSMPFTENILYFLYRVNFKILYILLIWHAFSLRNLCAQDLVFHSLPFLS